MYSLASSSPRYGVSVVSFFHWLHPHLASVTPSITIFSNSPSVPSSLHPIKGTAAIIQFPPGIYGLNPGIGIHQERLFFQKHKATPIAHVIVGVTKIRILLIPSHTFIPSSRHPAPIGQGGRTPQTDLLPKQRVGAANIGSHSPTQRPSPAGNQNNVGSFPGARGAQLSGVAIHPPHQNPQLNPSRMLSIYSRVSSMAS